MASISVFTTSSIDSVTKGVVSIGKTTCMPGGKNCGESVDRAS